MKNFLSPAILVLAMMVKASGQMTPPADYTLEDIICKEQARASRYFDPGGYRNPASDKTDITYQEMHWTIDPAVYHIQGEITYVFTSRIAGLSEFILDLSDALEVISVTRQGAPLAFTHGASQLLMIDLGRSLTLGETDTLTVAYHGMPPSNGFGSFEQSAHSGAPVIWTLSEPYGVRDWWPGKQDLVDKIDSVDIYIRTPVGHLAASNGKLVASTPVGPGEMIEHHWRHRYPIAAYLIALAVTNYAAYSHFMPIGSADTLEILNYVYPENLVQAEAQTPRTMDFIRIYGERFGRYPFAEEKYGHAQFGWGGGMEHQTMSFMANFSYELIAHELAHQWFGNKVTCQSWAEIWMNEGFATYLTGLTYEQLSPDLYWPAWKRNVVNNATSQPGGSVWVSDTTNVNRIFSGRLTYNKGAYLLHMLRWIVGDEAFFAACRDYLDLAGTAYAFGSTAEFQGYLEQRGGRDLDEFFADWFYGEGWPAYAVRWSGTPDSLILWIHQTPSHPSVNFFEMPVPVRVYSGTTDTLLRLDHAFNDQRFAFDLNGVSVDSVKFDPDLYLLSRNNTVEEVITATQDLQPSSGTAWPNPAQSFLEWQGSDTCPKTLTMTAADGHAYRIPMINCRADVTDLPPGLYFLRPDAGEHAPGQLQKILILR